jgi:hypothetical protein
LGEIKREAAPLAQERQNWLRDRLIEVASALGNSEIPWAFRTLDEGSPHWFDKGAAGFLEAGGLAKFKANEAKIITHVVMTPAFWERAERSGRTPPDFLRRAETEELPLEFPDDARFDEGRPIVRLHLTRERCPELVRLFKSAVLSRDGRLRCEVCAFDFAETYGAHGEGYAEAHHCTPLASLTKSTRFGIEDLALVCANCHRMLHRPPLPTVEALREIWRKKP